MTAEWRSAVAYLLAEEGLQHLAEEEQQRVPGVQQVGAVHGHVLGRELESVGVRDRAALLVFLSFGQLQVVHSVHVWNKYVSQSC